jgi:hypothetical protein
MAMRSYHLDTKMDENLSGRYCFEFIIYDMFADDFLTEEDKNTERFWYANASALAKTLNDTIYGTRLKSCRVKEAPGVEE